MKTWEEFNRYSNHTAYDEGFWGCVNRNGEWFFSSESFEVAIHWCCCYHAGQFELSNEQEREWFETEGKRLGLSIIHSDMLKQMYEKGLLK